MYGFILKKVIIDLSASGSMAGWNGFNNAADIGRLSCVASSIPYGKCGRMAMAGHGNGEVKGSFHAKKKERTFGRFSSAR